MGRLQSSLPFRMPFGLFMHTYSCVHTPCIYIYRNILYIYLSYLPYTNEHFLQIKEKHTHTYIYNQSHPPNMNIDRSTFFTSAGVPGNDIQDTFGWLCNPRCPPRWDGGACDSTGGPMSHDGWCLVSGNFLCCFGSGCVVFPCFFLYIY